VTVTEILGEFDWNITEAMDTERYAINRVKAIDNFISQLFGVNP